MTKRTSLLVAAAAAFVALVVWVLLPPSEQPFHDMVAKMRAAGEAVDYDDLRGKDVPPEENGAADVLAALDWLDANMPREKEWTAPGPWNVNSTPDWRDHATPEQLDDLANLARTMSAFANTEGGVLSGPGTRTTSPARDPARGGVPR